MNKLIVILTTALLLAGATTFAQRQQIGTSTTYWELSISGGDTTLKISGTGAMPDFANLNSIPWYSIRTTLAYLQIGDSITRIGENAFYECRKIPSVSIPNSVTSIGGGVFRACRGLTSATIGNSVTSIGAGAFAVCRGLTSIIIPNSVTSIGNFAFDGCTGLTSVSIGNSVANIGDEAFSGCTGLTSVTIPNSVTSIGDKTFFGCSGLTSVSIPASVTSIGNTVFSACSSLTAINVAAANPNYSSLAGVFYNNNKTTLIQYPRGKTDASFTIPASVTSVGDQAFSGCIGLTSLTIGNSVTNIGDYAFSGCTGLTEVINLRPTPITIDANVFYNVTIAACSLKVPLASVAQYQAAPVWGNFQIAGGDYLLTTSVNNPAAGSVTGGGFYPANATVTLTATPNAGYTFQCWTSNGVVISTANPLSHTLTNNTAIMAHFVQQIGSSNTWWELIINGSDTTLKISGTGDMPDFTGTSTIPWYSIKDDLDYLQIDNSITRIGNFAFYGCKGLTSVTIPNSVTSIGEYAFQYCSGLTSVTIPNSVTSIESAAFSATVLAAVTIPNSVTSLGEGVFLLTPLISVSIPSSITSIPNSAFGLCTYLTSVQIPNTVTSIGDDAFGLCSGLTTITIPASVASIGERAFQHCTGLTEVVNLRPTPVTIDANVFTGVTISACSLKVLRTSVSQYQGAPVWGNFKIGGGDYLLTVSVDNPTTGTVTVTGGSLYPANATTTLTAIPSTGYTFRYWTSNGVEISTANPLNLTVTKDTAITAHFGQRIGTSNTWWELVINGSDTTLKITGTGAMPDFAWGGAPWYSFHSTLRYLEIGDNITHIGNSAFSYCYRLTSASIGNSVTSIGTYAFDDCSGLTSVTIPNSVISIGNSAFSKCSGLTSLTIGNSVTNIGNSAFAACKGLTSVSIPASVTSIGNSAFSACSSLISINVAADNPNYSSLAGVFYNKDKTTLIRYPIGKPDASFSVPNSVIIIVGDAFRDCSNLTSVTIPNSVTSIGNETFMSCSGLTSISIPNSVIIFGNYVFYGCKSLTSATIGNSVKSIESYTFAYCSSLTSVIIGNSVTSIGMDAFRECTGLTSVIIPNSVTSIEMYAFKDCTGLTEIINLQAEPLTINANIFDGVTISACTLKVAISSVSKYQAAAVWKDFNIVGSGYLVSASVNNAAYGTVSGEGLCQANGTHTLTAVANAGYVFTHWTLSGVTLSTDNPCNFTVTQDIELTAHFKPTLSNLTVSEGTLTPAFHQDILNYSVEVDAGITSITLTAQCADPDALVIGDGTHTLTPGDNTFTIVVIDQDKVTTLTYTVKVTRSTVGIDELTVESREWKVYPNPTSGKLQVTSDKLQVEQIDIFDVNGKRLVTFNLPLETQEIDISHLSNGIYFIKIKTENGEVVKKIIKN